MTAMTSPTAATRFETLDWYETPKYYDIVFDVDTSKEADFLAAMSTAGTPCGGSQASQSTASDSGENLEDDPRGRDCDDHAQLVL